MAWHAPSSHMPAAEFVLPFCGLSELFNEKGRTGEFAFLWQDATLKRDLPPFHRGDRIKFARFSARYGYLILSTDSSRYYYQAAMRLSPVHQPLKRPCAVCSQFEREGEISEVFSPESMCLFCRSREEPLSEIRAGYEKKYGSLNRDLGKVTHWHEWKTPTSPRSMAPTSPRSMAPTSPRLSDATAAETGEESPRSGDDATTRGEPPSRLRDAAAETGGEPSRFEPATKKD